MKQLYKKYPLFVYVMSGFSVGFILGVVIGITKNVQNFMLWVIVGFAVIVEIIIIFIALNKLLTI